MTIIVYKRKRKRPEHSLQIQVIDWLRWNKFLCCAIPNGGSRDKKEGANLKREGVLAGHSDINVYLKDGKTVFLELKAGNNKQQLNQIEFQQKVEALGFEYHLIRSLDDVTKIFGL